MRLLLNVLAIGAVSASGGLFAYWMDANFWLGAWSACAGFAAAAE